MQTNLLWTGRAYDSLENCWVNESEAGAEINATIIGYYEETIYRVEYRIVTNARWETQSFQIDSRFREYRQCIQFERDGSGGWQREGERIDALYGCLDIDIPLTPFTNTLPIRRLQLVPAESAEIDVIYCDILNQDIRRVRQRYTCLTEKSYRYENVPNDFEARIQVDASGFVEDYPELFRRTAIWSQGTQESGKSQGSITL